MAHPIQPNWQPDKLPWSRSKRVKFFLTGVVLPCVCFLLALAGEGANPDRLWQSGEAEVYAALLLGRLPLLCFMPLLLLSMAALTAICISSRAAQRGWVRLGVWTGMLLTIQFAILLMITLQSEFLLCLGVATIYAGLLALIVYVASVLAPKNWQISMSQIFLLTTLVAFVALFYRVYPNSLWNFAMSIWILSAVAAPVLAILTYSRAAIRLAADYPAQIGFLFPGIGWITSWLAAWRYAVIFMLDEYSKLPTSDPSCYVSAAAAHGHPNFVGTFTELREKKLNVVLVGPPADSTPVNPMPINMQMCRLKFLELALKAASPPMHCLIRKVYDRLGPGLAAFCRRDAWIADTAYLTLKPIELLAYCVQLAARINDCRLRRLYR